MSNIPQITIEKRTLKVSDTNEDFVLEYPSNYEELVNKKLQYLEQEYEEAQIEENNKKNNEKNNENENINNIDENNKNDKNNNDKIEPECHLEKEINNHKRKQ